MLYVINLDCFLQDTEQIGQFFVFRKSLIMSAGKTLSVLVNVVLWLQNSNNNNNNYKMNNQTQPSHNNSTMIHLFNDSTFHATSEPPAGSAWYYVFLFLSLINTICHGMGVWLLTSTYKDRKVIKNISVKNSRFKKQSA